MTADFREVLLQRGNRYHGSAVGGLGAVGGRNIQYQRRRVGLDLLVICWFKDFWFEGVTRLVLYAVLGTHGERDYNRNVGPEERPMSNEHDQMSVVPVEQIRFWLSDDDVQDVGCRSDGAASLAWIKGAPL